jgi:hypothetical protein
MQNSYLKKQFTGKIKQKNQNFIVLKISLGLKII